MNARFYDANTTRFLSQDTFTGNAWEPWTQNLYSYCGNNPVNYVDPTGHTREDDERYALQPIYTREVNIFAYFTGNNLSEENTNIVLAGIEDWNQTLRYDETEDCFYTLTMNTEIVSNSQNATLHINIDKSGSFIESGDNRAHLEYNKYGKREQKVGTFLEKMYLYTDGASVGHSLQSIVRHETGHVLGLDDAYSVKGFNYYDPRGVPGSIMRGLQAPDGSRGFITTYDVRIAVLRRQEDNYNATKQYESD